MHVNGIGSIGATTYRLERANSDSDTTSFDSALRSATAMSAGDLDSVFQAASNQYNVPVNLLKAVAKVESNFNPNATSRCGAMGVMQLMPRTAQGLGVNDAYNAQENIMGGAKYLSQLLHRYDGNTALALAAYNAGPGRVNQAEGVPSFAQGYVDKVMKYVDGGLSVGNTAAVSSASTGESALSTAANSGNSDQLSTMLMIYQLLMNTGLGGEQDNQDDQNTIF